MSRMLVSKQQQWMCLLLLVSVLWTEQSWAFPLTETIASHRCMPSTSTSTTTLFATKKKKTAASKKKKAATPTIGGFGGASMAPCPCGSGDSYKACCGRLHRDTGRTLKQATAEQVVRARYAAFSRQQPDFLMATTHPLNKEFQTDLRAWKASIRLNMYDKFDLNKCHIVREEYEEKDDENDGAPTKAVVQFIAQMVLKESGEVTAFMETANLERFQAEGAPWLYVNGTIEAVPEDYARENNIQLHEHDEEASQDEEETSSAASSEEQKGEGAVVAEPEDSNLTDNHSQ